jgi:hypothetical protein
MLIHWHKKNPAGNPGGADGRKIKPDGEQTIIKRSTGNLFRFTDDLLINASAFCLFFYHPDYTVGAGISPAQSCTKSDTSRGLSPPVGNSAALKAAGTLPRRNHFLKMPENDVSKNLATKVWFFGN